MHFANVVKHGYISSRLGDMEQWFVEFPNGYGASILFDIRESEFEVGVLLNDVLCFTTPIADDVLPHLTYDEVIKVLEDIRKLTPNSIGKTSKSGLMKMLKRN